MENFRSWPRWIRFGLISAVVALQIFLFLVATKVEWLVLAWAIVPVLFVLIVIKNNTYNFMLTFISVIALLWFLIGGLLGRYVTKESVAVAIWLFIALIMLISGGFFYLAVGSV